MQRLTLIPTYSTAAQSDQRILAMDFGDGYKQRAPDGINANRLAFDLEFGEVTSAKASAVKAFIEQHGAITPFIWTPPPPFDTPRAFVFVLPWDFKFNAFDSNTIRVRIEEEKNPVLRCGDPVIGLATLTITMTTATVGAAIRYTDDGTDPTETTGTVYGGAFTGTAGRTYKAIATRIDSLPSLVTSRTI